MSSSYFRTAAIQRLRMHLLGLSSIRSCCTIIFIFKIIHILSLITVPSQKDTTN